MQKFYRSLYLVFFVLLSINTNCSMLKNKFYNDKTNEFNKLLGMGKNAYYKEDYENAIKYLNKAVIINPQNQESHYFLGYSYEKYSVSDATFMLKTNLFYTQKASEHFKKVIEISPKYTGEKIVLDPYSKLTASWGSLAMSYIAEGNIDSARWAFEKGEAEGGFIKILVEYNKNIMATCERNAILFTNGDNDTFPMLFLQAVNKYRADITIVNLSMLNTHWYIKYLKNKYTIGENNLNLSFSDSEIDSIGHKLFSEQEIKIKIKNDVSDSNQYMKWILKPTLNDNMLRIQDIIVLDILKENKWIRPIYYAITVAKINKMCLDEFLRMDGLAFRLLPYKTEFNSEGIIEKNFYETYSYDNVCDTHFEYIPDMVDLYSNYRICLYMLANKYAQNEKREKVKNTIDFMKNNIPENCIPITNDKLKLAIDQMYNWAK